jgi:hypothetical protein
MRDVVVLIERPLSKSDAKQIVTRYEGADEPTRYHLLIPVEDAATRVEATVGSLAASEVLGTSALYLGEQDLERIREEVKEASRQALESSVAAMRSVAHEADGEVTAADPVARLEELVAEKGATEVVILTRPHLVAELLHVDWTSKAKKRLSVPCVHLLAQGDKQPAAR